MVGELGAFEVDVVLGLGQLDGAPNVADRLRLLVEPFEDDDRAGLGDRVGAVLGGTLAAPGVPAVDHQPDHRDERDQAGGNDDEDLARLVSDGGVPRRARASKLNIRILRSGTQAPHS